MRSRISRIALRPTVMCKLLQYSVTKLAMIFSMMGLTSSGGTSSWQDSIIIAMISPILSFSCDWRYLNRKGQKGRRSNQCLPMRRDISFIMSILTSQRSFDLRSLLNSFSTKAYGSWIRSIGKKSVEYLTLFLRFSFRLCCLRTFLTFA